MPTDQHPQVHATLTCTHASIILLEVCIMCLMLHHMSVRNLNRKFEIQVRFAQHTATVFAATGRYHHHPLSYMSTESSPVATFAQNIPSAGFSAWPISIGKKLSAHQEFLSKMLIAIISMHEVRTCMNKPGLLRRDPCPEALHPGHGFLRKRFNRHQASITVTG